jgi:outer membrane protein assembly factor BamB
MKTSELVLIGIRGSVVALNRATGEEVWSRRLKGMCLVNVMLEDDRVFAICYGETYCLDALTGELLWHNRLKGYGIGLATLATLKNPGNSQIVVLEQKHRRDQQGAASAA